MPLVGRCCKAKRRLRSPFSFSLAREPILRPAVKVQASGHVLFRQRDNLPKFLRFHRQHRPRRIPYDLFGNASHENVAKPRAAMRGHHNQVHPGITGSFHVRRCGLPVSHNDLNTGMSDLFVQHQPRNEGFCLLILQGIDSGPGFPLSLRRRLLNSGFSIQLFSPTHHRHRRTRHDQETPDPDQTDVRFHARLHDE